MSDLPAFRTRPTQAVIEYVSEVLTNFQGTGETAFVRLVEYNDNSYRAVFHRRYFTIPEGQTEPSKSQWNSLKKKMKRHDPRVFIFKEHGATGCETDEGSDCYYVDFGFFEH
jgi:hypothetical protein